MGKPARIKTVELFHFDQLSDAAKERARDWYRGCIDSNDFDSTIEDFMQIAEMIGISFKTSTIHTVGGQQRQEPCIWWDLGRGDSTSFEGTYSYRPDAAQKIAEHASQDEELERIVALLQVTQAHNGGTLCAQLSSSGLANYQLVEVTQLLDEDNHLVGDELPSPVTQIIEQCLKDLGSWLHKRLQAEQDYIYSDENVDDAIEANEYTFTEDGKRED